MKKSENLSHHEQLRLDYLYKNYYYLNDKEKKEFSYLRQKSKGQAVPSGSPQASRYEEPSASQSAAPAEEPAETDSSGLLPKYPEQPSRSRKERKAQQAAAETASGGQQPKKKGKKIRFKRILLWLGIFLLMVLGGMIFMFIKGLTTANNGNSKPAETEYFDGQDTKDGVNILILGTDGRVGEDSTETRTDSIMVLNVGNKDHKIKLVSFMRDTLIHIDGISNEYSDPSQADYYDQKLNSAYTIGEQNHNRGADYVRQMLKDNFDLDIKYYALVDFQTFATAIDTLFPNGVSMNAQFSTIDGEAVSEVEVPDDLNMQDGVVPNQTIKVGQQQMDGRTLLNYARFRKDDEGDFGRTRRQQEVLTAIFQQVKDPTKLFTGSEALGKVFALTSTNVPYSFLLTNGISLAADSRNGVERLTIPENGDWIDTYDMYGGQGLLIDFDAYKERLAQLGFR
ncbi:Cell envelope-associated transcriptional attenuator LytR-CpsA-Psr, subfamily F1 [Streptococcus sp. DD11]|uniref:LCP family protein n=1 Tax=Streptococcus sp. DD11 TaxID=1777879 RepID=UPI000794DD59|nr:LCP family protein [Streptococcus sp. DD11]KXT79571.1 Cell envelope-associated transcriptional attenuator LytR-CpsA-Psr, subfamily F1 [Streptococcus sp. DD11]